VRWRCGGGSQHCCRRNALRSAARKGEAAADALLMSQRIRSFDSPLSLCVCAAPRVSQARHTNQFWSSFFLPFSQNCATRSRQKGELGQLSLSPGAFQPPLVLHPTNKINQIILTRGESGRPPARSPSSTSRWRIRFINLFALLRWRRRRRQSTSGAPCAVAASFHSAANQTRRILAGRNLRNKVKARHPDDAWPARSFCALVPCRT